MMACSFYYLCVNNESLQTEKAISIPMKTASFTLLISILALGMSAGAQDCSSSYFITKQGTKIEMTNYGKNGKKTGKSVTTLVSVKQNGAVTEYALQSESTDSKGEVSTMDFTASCDGNTVSVNMKGFFPPEMGASAEGGEMTLEGNDISFPGSMTAGEKLNDGTVTMTMSMGAMKMKTVMNILNRTVAGQETITTPAGTFDCYKIEYLVETTMMGMKTSAKVRQWIAKGVGTVRSENLSAKGDLMGYSEVTAIQ